MFRPRKNVFVPLNIFQLPGGTPSHHSVDHDSLCLIKSFLGSFPIKDPAESHERTLPGAMLVRRR